MLNPTRRCTGRTVVTLAVVAIAAGVPDPAAAQPDTVVVVEGGVRVGRDSRIARQVVHAFNTVAGVRIFGRLDVGAGERLDGDVAVMDGPVRVAGIIDGDLVVINSDVQLGPRAVIRGDVFVVGGRISGLEGARVAGGVRVYRAPVAVERVGERLRWRPARRAVERDRRRPRRRRYDAGPDVGVALSVPTYNRVEGAAIELGPEIVWSDGYRDALRLSAAAILRTAGGLDSLDDDAGYDLAAAWSPHPRLTLRLRGYDRIDPIEPRPLSLDENTASALLWHRDYRDYLERRGVSAGIEVEPTRRLGFGIHLARETHATVTARDPWTASRNDEAWRPNPAIDDGRFTIVTARATWNDRPDDTWDGAGWWVRAEYEHGRSDDVAFVSLPTSVRATPVGLDLAYDRVSIDLRRYEPVGRSGQLRLRAMGVGSLEANDPLPVQRRVSLGGPDPLPGFRFRELACGPTPTALCDRAVVFQAEYRGRLSFHPWDHDADDRWTKHDTDHDRWDDWWWFDGPTIVLFADAGAAWLGTDSPDRWHMDVGAGVTVGGLGVYAARALSADEPVRLALRLERRF